MGSLVTSAESFDLRQLPASFYSDPYPVYRALREQAPVKRLPDGSLFLTRYADCVQVYKNPRLFSSDKAKEFKPKYGDSLLFEHHTSSLVFNDAPAHTRVRQLIAGALSPRAIGGLQTGLEALVDRLLDNMATTATDTVVNNCRDAPRQVDLIHDFASAIPIEVIGNLLGIPSLERAPLRDWSLAILGALEPLVNAEAFERGNQSVHDFKAYLQGLIARRRAQPGDPEQDVLTRLIQGDKNGGTKSQVKSISGDRLTVNELLHNCIFLLNAGHETTTNLIGNGLVLLHDHSAQRQKLLAHPELLPLAIEECLRFESSNQLGNRISTEATEIGGVAIAAHTPLTLCIGAANRDPAQFDRPDEFDIARHPNRHLAFGSGVHQCVGLNLARLEGMVAIGRFLHRFPDYHLPTPPERGARARFRGFVRIPCRPFGQ